MINIFSFPRYCWCAVIFESTIRIPDQWFEGAVDHGTYFKRALPFLWTSYVLRTVIVNYYMILDRNAEIDTEKVGSDINKLT